MQSYSTDRLPNRQMQPLTLRDFTNEEKTQCTQQQKERREREIDNRNRPQ
jgi:hypothetical protein